MTNEELIAQARELCERKIAEWQEVFDEAKLSGKEQQLCTTDGCSNKALYWCIVAEVLACEEHLPPMGQGTEYFWEIEAGS